MGGKTFMQFLVTNSGLLESHKLIQLCSLNLADDVLALFLEQQFNALLLGVGKVVTTSWGEGLVLKKVMRASCTKTLFSR